MRASRERGSFRLVERRHEERMPVELHGPDVAVEVACATRSGPSAKRGAHAGLSP